jgi:hypothetical protein
MPPQQLRPHPPTRRLETGRFQYSCGVEIFEVDQYLATKPLHQFASRALAHPMRLFGETWSLNLGASNDAPIVYFMLNSKGSIASYSVSGSDVTAIVDIAAPLGIAVHDYIIVGKNGHASLRGMKVI